MSIQEQIKEVVNTHRVVLFMKGTKQFPQCGFSSTEEGNLLTENQQWEKIKLIRRIAEQVWLDV